jgi:hypothetical protein
MYAYKAQAININSTNPSIFPSNSLHHLAPHIPSPGAPVRPLMVLRLGEVSIVIVSTPGAEMEVLKRNDLVFQLATSLITNVVP